MTTLAIALTSLILGIAAKPALGEPVTAQQVRQAVQRSLPYLEQGGLAWVKERKCSSCHQVTFMTWAHNEAQRAGIAVDADKLAEWNRWVLEFSATQRDKDGMLAGGGLDTMGQVILSGALAASRSDQAQDQLQTFLQLIVQMQQQDGSWLPGGQLPSQRRPPAETRIATAGWTVLALASLDKLTAEQEQCRQRALSWLKNARPGTSTESAVVLLLVEHKLGLAARTQELVRELVSRQNPDGGWGFIRGEASDALSTGQSLFALTTLGVMPDQAVLARAQTLLVRTQRSDGSWYVPTTKRGKRGDNEGMSSYWGTGWAAVGLARSLAR